MAGRRFERLICNHFSTTSHIITAASKCGKRMILCMVLEKPKAGSGKMPAQSLAFPVVMPQFAGLSGLSINVGRALHNAFSSFIQRLPTSTRINAYRTINCDYRSCGSGSSGMARTRQHRS